MRYENGSDFVEITHGMSIDHTRESFEVWCVDTNLGFIPEELAVPVRKTDHEGFENLKKVVSAWAETRGYVPVPSKPI
jgi:hypothetical protein